MRFYYFMILCLLLISAKPLFAKEVTLSITDNDDNKEVYNLVVNVDETTQSLKDLYKDTYIDGKKNQTRSFESGPFKN